MKTAFKIVTLALALAAVPEWDGRGRFGCFQPWPTPAQSSLTAMTPKKHHDPRAQAALEHLHAHSKDWRGAIRPRLLTPALPPRGPKRGWRDFVAHALLDEIISAHRPDKHGEVFFKGPLYRVVRRDLARQLCTSPDEISSALAWLAALRVVGRVERILLDEDGQPRGKEVYAYPIMSILQELVDAHRVTGKTGSSGKFLPRNGCEFHE